VDYGSLPEFVLRNEVLMLKAFSLRADAFRQKWPFSGLF
jgi:hypothetical protein